MGKKGSCGGQKITRFHAAEAGGGERETYLWGILVKVTRMGASPHQESRELWRDPGVQTEALSCPKLGREH